MAYRISAKTLVTIGKNIKRIRKQQDREQLEIATDAGIDVSYFARIERGMANPTLEVLYAVVKALRVKSQEVLPF